MAFFRPQGDGAEFKKRKSKSGQSRGHARAFIPTRGQAKGIVEFDIPKALGEPGIIPAVTPLKKSQRQGTALNQIQGADSGLMQSFGINPRQHVAKGYDFLTMKYAITIQNPRNEIQILMARADPGYLSLMARAKILDVAIQARLALMKSKMSVIIR